MHPFKLYCFITLEIMKIIKLHQWNDLWTLLFYVLQNIKTIDFCSIENASVKKKHWKRIRFYVIKSFHGLFNVLPNIKIFNSNNCLKLYVKQAFKCLLDVIAKIFQSFEFCLKGVIIFFKYKKKTFSQTKNELYHATSKKIVKLSYKTGDVVAEHVRARSQIYSSRDTSLKGRV